MENQMNKSVEKVTVDDVLKGCGCQVIDLLEDGSYSVVKLVTCPVHGYIKPDPGLTEEQGRRIDEILWGKSKSLD